MMFHVHPPPLPDESPRSDDSQLGSKENSSSDDNASHVYTETIDRFTLHKDGFGGQRALVVLRGLFKVEFVGDLNGLYEEQIVTEFVRDAGGGTTPTPFTVRDDGAEFTGWFFLVALDGLTCWHTGGDQSTELYDFGWGEFEGIEVRQQDL